jgi:non-heme chloroperoxidase
VAVPTKSTALTAVELEQIDAANASGRPVVVLVHGLWLLAGSWGGWRAKFDEYGYATIAPGWPDDPATVEAGRKHPSSFAGKSVGAITDHYAEAIRKLTNRPAIVGHSFGGLITQKLAGLGLASVSVPIDPAPARGVLPLPISALRAASPALGNPLNRNRAVMLTYKQFRYAFVNAVSEAEAKSLYDEYPVPGAGLPLFQAAAANLNPASEAKVDITNPERGPMKFISGEKDHTVPWAIANASYKRQKRNESVTEIEEIHGRGHSLVIDSGWEQVADVALAFIDKHKQ